MHFSNGDFMGMDVFGLNPQNDTGSYFRNNVWRWHPLAIYICDTCPEAITGKCADWHSNSGDGLDEGDAVALAEILDAQQKDGTTAEYVSQFNAWKSALPDETCEGCNSTGIRKTSQYHRDKVIEEPVHPRCGQKGWCDGCDCLGRHRAYNARFQLDIENIAEFSAFLRHCGGFIIR
jgi:hypothetical protein